MTEAQGSEAAMVPKKDREIPSSPPPPAQQKRSAAKEIRELETKYEVSRRKDRYHCEKIGIILKELEDGTGNWDNDLEHPALHRLVYGELRSLSGDGMITEEFAQEVRRNILAKSPYCYKTQAPICVTTENIALLAMGLSQSSHYPPYPKLGRFAFEACKRMGMMRRDNEYDVNIKVVRETISFLDHERFWHSIIQRLENDAEMVEDALISAIQSLKEVQAALDEQDQKIRERITNIISDPRSSSLKEKEQTYVNSVTEYAFDEETKIERDLVDGEIADLVKKLEHVVADGGW